VNRVNPCLTTVDAEDIRTVQTQPRLSSGWWITSCVGFGTQRPTANALLTTVADGWGRPWTPRCRKSSSGLFRRTVVDACGCGNPSEKRKVDSSILSLTTTDRHGRQPAAPALRLFRKRFRLYFNMSAGVCRGMPSCPWDVCGGGRGGGLVGFLWGAPEVLGGSRSW
jgi:hypothetical protein